MVTSEQNDLRNVAPLNYVDLLILTLTQHEKNLSLIIEKLQRISNKLDKISQQLADQQKGR